MLFYLVYLSAASNVFEKKDLKLILEKSRTNNVKSNVTGMLLFHDGNFIQVLEGARENVLSIYNNILADQRHKGIIKVVEAETDHRNFPEWSMGFKTITASEILEIEGYAPLSKKDFLEQYNFSGNEERKILLLLRQFVQTTL